MTTSTPTIDGKPILKGLSLAVNAGEVHAIMGPNGAGKSTLGYVLGGRPGYEVTGGLGDASTAQDLLALEPHERAAAGLFLGFQYPVEIPGVSNVQFLREALNAQRAARGEAPLSGGEFLKLARAQADAARHGRRDAQAAGQRRLLGRREEAQRDGPDGHHRPEASRSSTRPTAGSTSMRCASSATASTAIMRAPDKAVLLITHYQRLLDYVEPDFVHVLPAGRIVALGRRRSSRTSSSAKAMRRWRRD